MIKRQNLKVVENTVNKVSCAGDEKSGKHPLVYLTIKDGSAECYYCGKMFVTKDTHEKYLNKVRKKFKKAAKNVVKQSKDVVDAAKGKKRRGKKPYYKNKKKTNNNTTKKK